jgi:hypothetical protein
MLQHSFLGAGIEYRPAGVPCALDAFRLLEPLAPDHRLKSICERREASPLSTPTARRATCRLPVHSYTCSSMREFAPETVQLDHEAFMRLRSRGDTRPATAAQIRRVFALGYAPGSQGTASSSSPPALRARPTSTL